MAHLNDTVMQPLSQVASRVGLPSLSARLVELRALLGDDLRVLETQLQHVIAQNHACADVAPLSGTRVRGAAAHLLSLPGKRIRPLCVLLAARLQDYGMDDTLRDLAVACELTHAATLLHDDVIDDSSERRGAKASRVLFGNAASILAGDHLLTYALRLVLGTGRTDLLASLLQVISGMVAAEALQLERRGRFEPSEALYLEVIRGKTAALFAWGLQAGGTIANLAPPALAALGRIGVNLGCAFQLVDDALDVQGDPAQTGKDALVDVREGKLTWPIIIAAQRSAVLRDELHALASEEAAALSEARVRSLLTAVQQTGALQQTHAYAQHMAKQACQEAQALPPGQARQALLWIVEGAVHRTA